MKIKIIFFSRNRPDIRLNPVPAGYPASISGSSSGPVSKNFAGFLPDFSSKKCISKILKCIVFVQFWLDANSEKPEKYFRLKINRIAWKMEKIVSRSTLKNLDYENFRSVSFSIRTSNSLRAELVLLRGGLPSEIALQVQNCVSKGRCRFRKNQKYIFGSQGHMKRGENWFP